MKIEGTEFRVVKFSCFSSEDPFDLRFCHDTCWSRIYEYPFVLAEVKALKVGHISVHNCAWGFEGIDLVFKTWLDITYPGTVHSDPRASSFSNTVCWDIAAPPSEAWLGRFDAVVNVSTLGSNSVDHVEVLKHHLVQLAIGGRFIGTFDLPGLQIDSIEEFLGEFIVQPQKKLTPRSSRLEDKKIGLADDFSVGYLVIERLL